MELKDLQKNWDRFGKTDPLWAILGVPDKKGGGWQLDEFFATGTTEINAVMTWVKSLGITISRRTALDFGCGVGRLSQALADHFEEVYGVDIAPSMIDLATKWNRNHTKCKFISITGTILEFFLITLSISYIPISLCNTCIPDTLEST